MNDTPLRLFGLIGFPLTHSFSKKYFTGKFEKEGLLNCQYELFPLESPDNLPDLINSNPQLEGLNVTIPHKETVIPFLDELDGEARQIGAVNTITVRQGKLKGYNTDVYGFEKTLRGFLRKRESLKALVLGTGGASKAVAFVLRKMDIPFRYVSRQRNAGHLTYQDLDSCIMSEYHLVVNTTPLGTFPKVDECPPIPYEHLNKGHLLYDLVYNPGKTLFLANGERQGCQICNGLRMLQLQAERAWEIWNS